MCVGQYAHLCVCVCCGDYILHFGVRIVFLFSRCCTSDDNISQPLGSPSREAGAQRLRGCRRFATADASGGPFFSVLPEKKGEKRELGRVWCVLPLNSGWNQYFRRRSTRDSPYGRLTTRRLIRGYQICNYCLRTVATNRRCSLRLPGCTFLREGLALCVVGAGLCSYRMHSKRLPFQGSWQPKAD